MLHTKIIITAILFVLMMASGFWVTKSGRPYHTGIITLHKLISLATVVFMAITIIQLQKGVEPGVVDIILAGLTGLFFLLAIISGAFTSAKKDVHFLALITHKFVPYLLIVFAAITLYRLVLMH